MSAFESSRPVPLGAITVHHAVVFADRLVTRARAWRRERAAEMALGKLSDRDLADVGVSRGNLRTIAERLARG